MIPEGSPGQGEEARDKAVQARLHEKQLEFLISNSRVSIAASVFNGTIFLALLYDYLPRRELLYWYAALFLFSVPRLIVLLYRDRIREKLSMGQATALMVLGALASGVVWGLSAPLFFSYLPPLGQAFHILLLGGTLTGAAVYLAHLLPCFVAFTIPHVLPMHIVLLLLPDPFYRSMALLLFIFTMMMFFMAYRTNRQFTTYTLLQLRNEALMGQLNESEYLFRTLTEYSTSGVAMISADRFLYVNPAVEAISGYSQGELLAGRFSDIVHPEHREMMSRRAERRINGDSSDKLMARREFKILRRDGTERWIEYSPALVEFQGRKVILGACTDITDRIQAQQTRRENEERYRVLFETASDAMYVVSLDRDGRLDLFLDVNAKGCASLGYSRAELLHLGPRDITNLYELQHERELQKRLQQEGQAVYEASHVARDGSLIPVEVSAKLFRHEGRTAALCIARDISDRKDSERKLQAAKKQAEVASQAKSEFLANMSHEIRTPLNGLLGMLQLVRMGELDEERSRYLEVAMNSGESLLAIINDILDLSKIEAGKFELAPSVFNVHALVRGVAETFRFPADSKGVVLVVDMAEDVPVYISADQIRLRQILYNLVGNAVKFTHVGRIGIGLSVAAPNGDKTMLEIRVSDTGIGIPREQQQGLFEPFVQAAQASGVRASGTGLGLSIVKRIVGFMHGEVILESEPGQGTTVTARVEVAVAEGAPEPLTCSMDQSCVEPVPPMRVLVAEDNPVNQLMILKLLEKLGHEGVCAENGEEALEVLGRERFDCVLMDIQMPGLDGTEVTRLIRGGALPGVNPRIPIIALTAYALTGDREKFLSYGMDHYLSKPVSMAELSTVLARIASSPDHQPAPSPTDRQDF